ncbi:hypothetical protein [Xanthomonas campestris]|uniref:hypothetical protein n=1 Tax=Xanthomonas campestris TaxID=339 RepID=UPI00236789FF|nr:hypothetical protein [Xanthomonas campestris]WDJ94065.1 hypothetical protein JH260_00625 [Xanthomonas campestris pv. incanae]WDK25970.1 hypothetical protein JH274_00895 [Xanthomonas campestris pv. incanae]
MIIDHCVSAVSSAALAFQLGLPVLRDSSNHGVGEVSCFGRRAENDASGVGSFWTVQRQGLSRPLGRESLFFACAKKRNQKKAHPAYAPFGCAEPAGIFGRDILSLPKMPRILARRPGGVCPPSPPLRKGPRYGNGKIESHSHNNSHSHSHNNSNSNKNANGNADHKDARCISGACSDLGSAGFSGGISRRRAAGAITAPCTQHVCGGARHAY